MKAPYQKREIENKHATSGYAPTTLNVRNLIYINYLEQRLSITIETVKILIDGFFFSSLFFSRSIAASSLSGIFPLSIYVYITSKFITRVLSTRYFYLYFFRKIVL